MKQIVIIGDSHTRGFALRDNIIPVFLGPGKEINLDPKNRNQVLKKLKKIKRMFPIDRYDIYIYMGEPNIRFQLGFGWSPHLEKNKVLFNVNKDYIAVCCNNYIEYASFLNAKILTPTTGYAPSIEGLKYLTKLLKEKAKEITIDIFSDTIMTTSIKPFLLQKNYSYDPIHLNLNISDVFLNKLSTIDSKINIDNFKRKDNLNIYSKDLESVFSKNMFGTLSFHKNNFFIKLKNFFK